MMIADRPEARGRFTVMPGIVFGKPAGSHATRATLRPAHEQKPDGVGASVAGDDLHVRQVPGDAWSSSRRPSPSSSSRASSPILSPSCDVDSPPHNGAVITLLVICGMTHRQSYKDIGMVSLVIPVVALIVVVVLGSLFGAF